MRLNKLGVEAYAAELATTHSINSNQKLRFVRVVFEKSQQVLSYGQKMNFDFFEGHKFVKGCKRVINSRV